LLSRLSNHAAPIALLHANLPSYLSSLRLPPPASRLSTIFAERFTRHASPVARKHDDGPTFLAGEILYFWIFCGNKVSRTTYSSFPTSPRKPSRKPPPYRRPLPVRFPTPPFPIVCPDKNFFQVHAATDFSEADNQFLSSAIKDDRKRGKRKERKEKKGGEKRGEEKKRESRNEFSYRLFFFLQGLIAILSLCSLPFFLHPQAPLLELGYLF